MIEIEILMWLLEIYLNICGSFCTPQAQPTHIAAFCQILHKLLPGYKDETGNIAKSTIPNFLSSDAGRHSSLCKTMTST